MKIIYLNKSSKCIANISWPKLTYLFSRVVAKHCNLNGKFNFMKRIDIK